MTDNQDPATVDSISQADILEADVDDELAPYPKMASRAGCRKNWDSALLQGCTMDRHKIIARDYNTVHAPTR